MCRFMTTNAQRETPAPAISVVLPTHNGRRFINQSIESVVKQTWQDWELILVNDALNRQHAGQDQLVGSGQSGFTRFIFRKIARCPAH